MGNYKNYSNISNSIIGDNNQVNIQTNEVSTETWNLLKKELLESISKTEDSQNREILEHIYAYAIQKDKTGIVQYIKKHSYTIEKDILVGITCSAVYEFIKWCLGIYM